MKRFAKWAIGAAKNVACSSSKNVGKKSK